jgi:hypothetical protein
MSISDYDWLFFLRTYVCLYIPLEPFFIIWWFNPMTSYIAPTDLFLELTQAVEYRLSPFQAVELCQAFLGYYCNRLARLEREFWCWFWRASWLVPCSGNSGNSGNSSSQLNKRTLKTPGAPTRFEIATRDTPKEFCLEDFLLDFPQTFCQRIGILDFLEWQQQPNRSPQVNKRTLKPSGACWMIEYATEGTYRTPVFFSLAGIGYRLIWSKGVWIC